MTALPLTGKVALVTGGSRGIGAAIVRKLAADGAAVAFTYSSAPKAAAAVVAAVETAGGKAAAFQADSADPAAVLGAVASAVKAFGRLDILVNNAGILLHGPFEDVTLEDFDRAYAVNVRAPFVATQAASPHLTDGGRVIMIGSVTADRMGVAGGSVYGMTKAAVAGMARGLARDLGLRNVTVNTVQPGATVTDMNPIDGPYIGQLQAAIPRGRLGTPEEIADLVAFLAGPQSSYINGASLTVDGGYNI